MPFEWKFSRFLFISVVVIVSSVRSSSEVKLSNSTYQCCDQRVVTFDQNCEHEWHHDDQHFAHYPKRGSEKDFMTPCKEIKDGVMVLDRCVTEILAKKLCKKGGAVEEERINIKSVPCSGSPSTSGSVMMLLPLLGAIILLNK